VPPRVKNPSIPREINDIVMRALAPDVTLRYQRATDLLEDVLAYRTPRPRKPVGDAAPAAPRDASTSPRTQPREASPTFCWQCRKPLHARTDRCPFCGETQ
jgi:hypothetical protein